MGCSKHLAIRLTAGECVLCLKAEVERLKAENTQAKEAIAHLEQGKPLGELVGKQTIANQMTEIKKLEAAIDTIGTDADPMWVEACRLKTENEKLKTRMKDEYEENSKWTNGAAIERDNLKTEVKRLTEQYGSDTSKIFRLAKVISNLRKALEVLRNHTRLHGTLPEWLAKHCDEALKGDKP